MIRRAALLGAAIAIAALLAWNVPEAFAHATPMVYEPNASAVLEKAPERIRIQFSEHIEPKASGITVFAPDGARADMNNSSPDPADPRVFTVGMRDAGEGTYTVSWQVVSQDDGHFTKGGFSFTIGDHPAPAIAGANPVRVENSSTFSQAGAIGTELLGQAMLLAVLSVLALLWRSSLQRQLSASQQAGFQRSLSWLVTSGTALIVVGVLSFLVMKTLDLQESRAASFAATFQTFLGTVDGSFALYRGLIGIAFAAVFYVAKKKIFDKKSYSGIELILLALVAVMILIRARVSHAAASHFMPTFSILMNAFHLLAKEFWVGGLIVLTLILLPLLTKLGRASLTASILTSISKYTSIALALTGVTGAYIIWLHLKSPENIFTTQWGARFIVLSAFAGVLVLIRLYHQLIAESCLVAANAGPQAGFRKRIVSGLRYSLPLEMGVGVALLFVTSYLIITTPPYPPEHFSMEKREANRGAAITLSVHPFEQKQFLITVSDEKTGAALPVTEAVITLQNVEKNIGPVVAETEPRFAGGFTFARDTLSLPGKWDIEITARRPGTYDAVASFELDYPTELEASRVSGDARHFGAFEAVMVFVALSSVVVSIFLYAFSARLNTRTGYLNERRGLPMPVFAGASVVTAAVPATLVVCLAIWASYDGFVKTSFEKMCEQNNGTWTQAAPMRAGLTLSSDAVTGCTAPSGNFHFADMREYAYYLSSPAAADRVQHQ